MTIKNIGIIGAGTMGHGIALVCAKAGYDVTIHDVKDEYVKKGLASVEKFLTKSVEKGQAVLVAIAKDASPPEIVMHLPVLCKEKGIPCVEVPTKEELGVSAGIGVPTASVAIVKEGDAKNLLKEIKTALKM